MTIEYNIPGMLGTAGEMGAYGGVLRAIGGQMGSHQATLAATWEGDTGMTYQSWQQQWNQALEDLCQGYEMMRQSHENNTTTMAHRDQAEGAKWGG